MYLDKAKGQRGVVDVHTKIYKHANIDVDKNFPRKEEKFPKVNEFERQLFNRKRENNEKRETGILRSHIGVEKLETMHASSLFQSL